MGAAWTAAGVLQGQRLRGVGELQAAARRGLHQCPRIVLVRELLHMLQVLDIHDTLMRVCWGDKTTLGDNVLTWCWTRFTDSIAVPVVTLRNNMSTAAVQFCTSTAGGAVKTLPGRRSLWTGRRHRAPAARQSGWARLQWQKPGFQRVTRSICQLDIHAHCLAGARRLPGLPAARPTMEQLSNVRLILLEGHALHSMKQAVAAQPHGHPARRNAVRRV